METNEQSPLLQRTVSDESASSIASINLNTKTRLELEAESFPHVLYNVKCWEIGSMCIQRHWLEQPELFAAGHQNISRGAG